MPIISLRKRKKPKDTRKVKVNFGKLRKGRTLKKGEKVTSKDLKNMMKDSLKKGVSDAEEAFQRPEIQEAMFEGKLSKPPTISTGVNVKFKKKDK